MNIVDEIHDKFLEEAKNSPILLNDLSNMEKYISESYFERSLIELLQNADDAGATRFLINKLSENVYIIANNGRVFSKNDLVSLCRSGASTKKRKSGTIGFRGIGFKSVVNFSKEVHLVSGEIETTFSKELTKVEVPFADSVPLVRIPHKFTGIRYLDEIKKTIKLGYNTVFVFITNSAELENEIHLFTVDNMIFLHSVSHIMFDLVESKKELIAEHNILNNHTERVICYINNEKVEWLVYNNSSELLCSAAFKIENDHVIAADAEESHIHSFLPTSESFGIPIKINSDFSTDPSRTKVIMDKDSLNASKECGSLLASIVNDVLDSGKDQFGVVNILSKGSLDPLRTLREVKVSDYIIEEFYNQLARIIKTKYANNKDIYLQNDGITCEDFEDMVNKLNAYGIDMNQEQKINGIMLLSKSIGINTIPLNKILKVTQNSEYTQQTRLQVITDIINDSRLGIQEDIAKKLKTSKLFTFSNNQVKALNEVSKTEEIDDGFRDAIIDKLGSSSSLEWFSKKCGINMTQKETEILPLANFEDDYNQEILGTVKKWRSAEENFTNLMQQQKGISTAVDVSKSNLGYDVEVVLDNGEHQYYEVKSVDNIGDEFSMTNNEMTAAMQYKEKFYLAITTISGDKFVTCMINDPIHSLHLTKRVVRYEWICDCYQGNTIEANII